MSDWAIEFDAASRIAAQHGADRDAIEGLEASLPTSIDGGDASELLASVMSLVTRDAGTMSEILGAASLAMEETVDLYWGVEESSEKVFRDLEKRVSG